jgi:hypothetical protein
MISPPFLGEGSRYGDQVGEGTDAFLMHDALSSERVTVGLPSIISPASRGIAIFILKVVLVLILIISAKGAGPLR